VWTFFHPSSPFTNPPPFPHLGFRPFLFGDEGFLQRGCFWRILFFPNFKCPFFMVHSPRRQPGLTRFFADFTLCTVIFFFHGSSLVRVHDFFPSTQISRRGCGHLAPPLPGLVCSFHVLLVLSASLKISHGCAFKNAQCVLVLFVFLSQPPRDFRCTGSSCLGTKSSFPSFLSPSLTLCITQSAPLFPFSYCSPLPAIPRSS